MKGTPCVECGFMVDDSLTRCPVCGALRIPDPSTEAPYPPYRGIVRRHRRKLAQKVANFAFIVAILVVVVVNFLYRSDGWWMWTVLPILAYGWFTVVDTVLASGRLVFRLSLQVYALSALLVVLDWRLGWTGWSTTFALPFLCIGTLVGGGVALVVAYKARSRTTPIGFIVAVSWLAIVLPFLGFFGLLSVGWPALVAALCGVTMLIGVAVFFRRDLAEHMRSQWHF